MKDWDLTLYGLGFGLSYIIAANVKSYIVGCFVTDTLYIQSFDKRTNTRGQKYYIPLVPEILGGIIGVGLLYGYNKYLN